MIKNTGAGINMMNPTWAQTAKFDCLAVRKKKALPENFTEKVCNSKMKGGGRWW